MSTRRRNGTVSTLASTILAALAFVGIVESPPGVADVSAEAQQASPVQEGQRLYGELCQSCHGPEGEGDGAAAESFPLRPRPFSQAAFKFDADADWETGTDADLAQVIRQGAGAFGGSALMPPWPGLTDDQIDALIGYIRSLNPTTPPPDAGFSGIYGLLVEYCGDCHVQGQADGPWVVDAPADPDRFPDCVRLAAADQRRCTTWHQLVDSPGPDIPAWVSLQDPASSEPYVQACVQEGSFHIGHSIPGALSATECASILGWIQAGASY